MEDAIIVFLINLDVCFFVVVGIYNLVQMIYDIDWCKLRKNYTLVVIFDDFLK